MSAGLHAKTSIVDEKNEIRSLAVATFPHLELGFMGRRVAHETVETKFDCHPTRVSDISPRTIIVWVLPVRKTSKGLDDLYSFPRFDKGTSGKLVCHLLASLE